ncbi:MAG: prepilin-type N-terminal cleavage/methylation domain-containing protein [Chloroflexi bacterium]|nr:prepilin-type N-terminal cleavage/methylation domain-containing protein [Chloroflexota bacterium]
MKGFIERLRYGERRFRRTFRHGEKGFTLMELLIVIAVLGVLAAVLVPRMGAFLSSGQVAAANTEVANVETAALAFYADASAWPADTNTAGTTSLRHGPGGEQYLSKDAVHNYTFDTDGKVVVVDNTVWPNDAKVFWDVATHTWKKQTV